MRFALIVLVSVFSMACAGPFYLNTQGYKNNSMNLAEAWRVVSEYRYVGDTPEYNKSPMEFFESGCGDCFDFSSALVYLLGPRASVVTIEDYPVTHAIVLYNGEYIEPQLYGKYYSINDITIVKIVSYKTLMARITEWGTKGMQK
jgi:hypothetical protein